MGLESTIICVDNSEYMRNGDYVPNRLQAQQDAVNSICRFKLRSNPENNVGLITLSHNAEIVATLTSDVAKVLTSLHHVQPGGLMNLLTGLRIAHLALKHRCSRSHRMKVVCFVGSPLINEEKEIIKVAKKLKKESVVIDIINFGETDANTKLLELLISTVNGKDSTASHLITIPAPCSDFSKALVTSAVMASEEGGPNPAQFATGGSFEFGVDPNEDPELALALRVSMEEQRQRQQEEERRTTGDTAATAATPAGGDSKEAAPAGSGDSTPELATPATPVASTDATAASTAGDDIDEDEMLQQALALSMDAGASAPVASRPQTAAAPAPDFATMTEDEQIAYAMQISMQDSEPMEVDAATAPKKEEKPAEDGMKAVMHDAAFLEGVLNKLPGVNPKSDVVKQAIDSYTGASATTDSKEEKDKKTKKTDEVQDKKE